MEKLITGLHQFQSQIFPAHQELFKRLTRGQEPEALLITCSDSRISPNLITQTDPGELFILRNAGNIVPKYGASNGGEGATIEFALGVLKVREIIVCGHSHCGAIDGLLNPHNLKDLPTLLSWLSHAEDTRLTVERNYVNLSGEKLQNVAAQENVLTQLENLRTYPMVAERLASGDLKLHGWMYKLQTGQFFTYDSDVGQFLPITLPGSTGGGSDTLTPSIEQLSVAPSRVSASIEKIDDG
jgi:carbonic anhydrase